MRTDRRGWLKSVSAAALLGAAGRATWAVQERQRPRRVALIGCGWYGKCDLFRLIQVAPVEVVGLCDVDRRMLAQAADMVSQRQRSAKKPPTYTDYRKLLDEQQPEIVLVGTPDHWHALPMIAAVKRGADVYVQKPISVDIVEGRAMVAAARKYGRVVQVGTQRRSTPHLVEARQRVVQEGLLGRVAHVEIFCYYGMGRNAKAENSEPPDYLDYDMWTGPAPMRPYNPLVHPRRWRLFWEYGNGIMGDMCIHMLDMVRWMLDLGWPKRISSAGGILVEHDSIANIPDTQTAVFDYEDLQVVWTHRTWGNPPDPRYPWAAFFYGEKGTLKASVQRYEFIPAGKSEPTLAGEALIELEQYPEDRTEPDIELHVAAANRRHQQDFLKAIDERSRPVADIEEGYISSACCILANVAMQLKRTLTWDPVSQQVVGDDEACRLLERPYRKPWIHPTPDKV
ncbi:MAG: oxidoreductase [Pirellulaceae bacterium]|nr:MAG: oxidoreductase [Pirellulaceae bacterium]